MTRGTTGGEHKPTPPAEELLDDIRWNCEHCTARLAYEYRKQAAVHNAGSYVGTDPCCACRLRKYGYWRV